MAADSGGQAKVRSPLSDILDRRGVRRIAYFHCDHFEPWRWETGRELEANADDIVCFAERSAKDEFARRLTLFYKAQINYSVGIRARRGKVANPGDLFVFLPRRPSLERTAQEAMTTLLQLVNHDIQVHVHHENFTYNTAHTDPDLIRAFGKPGGRKRDADRFELLLKFCLETIRRETGLPMDRWFFVHGQWALNASDPSVCHITDEIAILMRNGGLGDFTFPAGRPNVDPNIEAPHFVRPVNAPRGYVLPRAAPELAFGNADAAESKFFIWASKLKHRGTSIDYYADHVIQDLQDPIEFAARILDQSYVADGTLYFKTHAHSMHGNYFKDAGTVVFPHQHPAVRRLLGTVFDAATSTGVTVDFLSAGEVYDEFITCRPPPPGGFPIKAPKDLLATGAATPILRETEVHLPHADRVNAIASEIILQTATREGSVDPAGGSYYESRARQSAVLAPYEARVAVALLREPPFDAIYEVGSGVSALSICLAMNGARSIGIERDVIRAQLGQTILDRLARESPSLAELCEIRRDTAPLALHGIDSGNSAIVFTNIASTISSADLDELIHRAASFRTVVVDLSRFFASRDKADQLKLFDRFVAAGSGSPAPISSPVDTYWIFRKPGTLDADLD